MLKSIKSFVLPNGLTLIVCPKNDAPIIAVQVWYKIGSAAEHDGIRGISHVLEHMMFRGSKNFGPQQHSRLINETGGHCNAFTAEDMTAFQNCIPTEYFELALQLEADRMSCLTLDPALFEIERSVIIEEYHTYMNNPVGRAFLEFRSALFGDHPYGVSPLGRDQDLKSMTCEDVSAYYKKYYNPDNASIVIVGDFESSEAVYGRVCHHFGSIPSGLNKASLEKIPVLPVSAKNSKPMVRVIDFDVPLLIVGFPVPTSAGMALEILQLVMSSGDSGRLHNVLVRERGVAVSVGGMNQFLHLCGISFFFAAFTPNVSAKKVESVLLQEIERVKTEPLLQGEWDKVKNSALTGRIFELYSSEQICSRLGFSHTVEGNYQLWVDRLAALDKLTPQELMQTALECWSQDKCFVLRIKPKKVKLLLYLVGLIRLIFKK